MNNKNKVIYQIINHESGEIEGAYSRAYHTEYEFNSIDSARHSNCHGEYKDRVKYKIKKYKVTYELIDDDIDPPTGKEVETYNTENTAKNKLDKKLNREADRLDLGGLERWNFITRRKIYEIMTKDCELKEKG